MEQATTTSPGPARYVPKPISDVPPAAISALVEDGCRDRLVLYVGAGISIASPACGPRGTEVADRLRPIVAELVGIAEADLSEADLESLAARLERDASDRLPELKNRAAEVYDFRDMSPNYGHEMVALLVREGLLRTVCANWDCAIENAGRVLGVRIEGVSQAGDLLNLPVGAVAMYKVHGCASRPSTLALTRDEVDKPERWAQAEVEGALAGGTVVFIGLGTLGAYVEIPVRELTEIWARETTTVRVVDPGGPSDPWKQALGAREEDVAVAMCADEFLDELVRACAIAALSRAAQKARELHDHEAAQWSELIVAGCDELRQRLADSPGDAILRWWRDGVAQSQHGHRFVFEPAGQVALMCVALLARRDGGPIAVQGTDGDLTVRSVTRYFEVACDPGKHRSRIEPAARTRVEARARNGRYAPGTPVTVAVHGAIGAFPNSSAPVDIAGANLEESDVAAQDANSVVFVRAENAMDGRLAA